MRSRLRDCEKPLGGIKIRVRNERTARILQFRRRSPRVPTSKVITRLSRKEAKRRVVHTHEVGVHRRFRDGEGARRHGDDSTTKCPLKMVPWETEESVVSVKLSVPKDLTCVAPRQGKCRSISRQGVR